jgi:DNA-binding response OmpR family regulator
MLEPHPLDTRSASSPWKVLVVDDDTVLLDAVRRGFEAVGTDVTACDGFEQARRALRAQRFDALITDVRLGAFNGVQLAVIARMAWPDIRVVVFSGYDDAVLRSEAEHAGARYVVKPVQVVQLMGLLGLDQS